MNEFVENLAQKPLAWFGFHDSESAIAVSSRIRLARNVAGRSFPGQAKLAERQEVLQQLLSAIHSIKVLNIGVSAEVTDLDAIDRAVLMERRLMTRELACAGAGSGVVINSDEAVSLMINEEDHLRMQTVLPGLKLAEAYAHMLEVDQELNAKVDMAITPKLGFLTACPTNVGTGMRASVMLHLPAHVISGNMPAVMNAAHKLGFTVRGALGEGTDAVANLFQISNQSTLGETEEEILCRLERIIRQLIWHEKSARIKLLHNEPHRVYDFIARSYGTLQHAYLLKSAEALDCLSALKLGVELNLFQKLDMGTIENLMLQVQPGHLQKKLGQMTNQDRDIQRAELVRKTLKDNFHGRQTGRT